MANIDKYEDYLDSRDIEERIVELTKEVKAYAKDVKNGTGAEIELENMQQDLDAMLDLKRQYIDSYNESSWEFGAQFIRESYFEQYAQEFAEDCGLINADANWPNSCIDWEKAAFELSMDYDTFTFDGVDYYAREA